MQGALVREAGQESGSDSISNACRAPLDVEVSSGAMHSSFRQGSLLGASGPDFHCQAFPQCWPGLFAFLEKSLTFAHSPSLFQSISFFSRELECPAGTL